MRARSILMLASVAMILVAAGIGNAFAATGYYHSDVESELYILDNNPAARITYSDSSDVPEPSTIGVGDNLYNYNRFANYGSSDWGPVNVWWCGNSVSGSHWVITGSPGDFHSYGLTVGQVARAGEASNPVTSGTVPGTYTYGQSATYYVSAYPWNQYAYSTNPPSNKQFQVS